MRIFHAAAGNTERPFVKGHLTAVRKKPTGVEPPTARLDKAIGSHLTKEREEIAEEGRERPRVFFDPLIKIPGRIPSQWSCLPERLAHKPRLTRERGEIEVKINHNH